MRKVAAERYRDIDFSRAKRGTVVQPEPGKTKISIRLDNTVIEFFRAAVDRAGGGNYQTLINDALLEHIHNGGRLSKPSVRSSERNSRPTAMRGGLTPGVSGRAPRAAEPMRSATVDHVIRMTSV